MFCWPDSSYCYANIVHVHTYVTGLGLAELRAAKATGAKVIATTHAASLGFTCQRGTMMRWGSKLCDGIVRPAKCAACQLQHRGAGVPFALGAALIPPSVGSIARRLPGKLGTVTRNDNLITHNQAAQREMLDLVDRFVVLSEWARNVLISNGAQPAKISLNRLGVRFPPAAVHARHAGSPLSVAYIGRFDPIKGVDEFARAIAMVPRSAAIRFEFHGPVQYMTEHAVVTRLKSIVGPDAWVTFGGELDAAGVRTLLNRIDVVCCPSRVVEGGPTVALEANAAGVPSSDLRFLRSPSSFATMSMAASIRRGMPARSRRFSPTLRRIPSASTSGAATCRRCARWMT